MTIYLDTSSWSRISELLISDAARYMFLLECRVQKPQFEIVYSKANVLESLRRENIDHIRNDFKCFREFAGSRLIDLQGNVEVRDPEMARNDVVRDMTIRNSLEPLFSEFPIENKWRERKDSLMQNPDFDKVKLNNIPDNEIIDELEKRLNKVIMNDSDAEKPTPIKFDKGMLENIVRKNLRADTDSFSQLAGYNENIEAITKAFADYIQTVMDRSFEDMVQASEGQIGTDIFKTLDRLTPDRAVKTRIFALLLAALQYHPDKAKLLRKKGVMIDTDDAEHLHYAANCDLLVMRDPKLAKRALAAMGATGAPTKIIGVDEFYKMLEEQQLEHPGGPPKSRQP